MSTVPGRPRVQRHRLDERAMSGLRRAFLARARIFCGSDVRRFWTLTAALPGDPLPALSRNDVEIGDATGRRGGRDASGGAYHFSLLARGVDSSGPVRGSGAWTLVGYRPNPDRQQEVRRSA